MGDGVDRVQHGERILEDHLHAGAVGQRRPGAFRSSTSWPRHRIWPAVGGSQPRDHPGHGGLARARAAHQRHHLAGLHVERDVVDGAHGVCAAAERPAQPAHRQQRRLAHDRGGRRPGGRPVGRPVDLGRPDRPASWRAAGSGESAGGARADSDRRPRDSADETGSRGAGGGDRGAGRGSRAARRDAGRADRRSSGSAPGCRGAAGSPPAGRRWRSRPGGRRTAPPPAGTRTASAAGRG